MSNTKQTAYETLISMIETLSGAFFFIDDTDTIMYANARAQVLSGATLEELRGNPFWRSAPQLVSTALSQAVLKTRQTQEPTEVEYGSPVTQRWLHVQLAPTVGGIMLQFHELRAAARHQEMVPNSQPFSVAAPHSLPVGSDTSTHKQAEDDMRVLIDAIPHLVWIMRPDGRCEYCNQRWCDYTGMTFQQAQGDGWLQAIHPDDQQPTLVVWQRAVQTGMPYETEQRVRQGTTGAYRWFLVRAMPHKDRQGTIVKWVGTSTDIDEQKRTEEALRQSQERIRALIDSNIIGITSNEWEGEVIVEANDAWLHMTGYTREDVRSRTLTRVKITPPEQAPLFERALQEVAVHGQHTPFETELVCKDGSHLPILAGGVLFQDRPRQMVSFVLDNSARKELEQRKDAFISTASHELRNPLTILRLQAALLHRQLAKQGVPASAPALASMETQINTIARLVEELLDVSKIQAGRLEYVRETVDLDALLREIADTMQQTHPSHRILVHGAVQTSLIGDRDRLGQVFTNLLSNAIKYSPDAQTVEMDLSASPETVTIRVRDHGLGIPREQREKIFERFYRAADPQQRAIPGLGMGLYIVAEIVKRHGGTISVDSEVGKGSTFTVTLPLKRDG
jgi:PAS domain S-box-containing protein